MESVVVAAIVASGDLARKLHFFVKVSPTPERPSTPDPRVVLTTALVWGYSPSVPHIYHETSAVTRRRVPELHIRESGVEDGTILPVSTSDAWARAGGSVVCLYRGNKYRGMLSL